MKGLSPLLLLFLLAFGKPQDSTATITDADEIRIGEALAKDYERQEGLQSSPQAAKIDAYLQTVGDRVAQNAQRKLPYRFHFDPSPNFKSAVALPGGQIYVGAGILAYIDTEDQLAAVLAHEIEHVALNQCRDRLIQQLAEHKLSAKEGDQLKVDPFLPGYGHEKEFAADREGVLLAMKAGYSRDAVIRLLQTFVVLGEQMPNTPKEARQNLEARIAQIRALPDASNPKDHNTERPLALP